MVKSAVLAPEATKEKISLDAKDRKIISVLSGNSRTPASQIARIVGLSKEVVNYRIEKMLKQNVITDLYTVIDIEPLGFNMFNIYLQFHTLTKEDEKKVVEFLLEQPVISWIISTSGKGDFMIQVRVENINQLEAVIMQISNRFVGLLKGYEVYIITEFHHISPKFLSEEVNYLKKSGKALKKTDLINKTENYSKINALDLKILKLLENNSRISVLEIGREVKLSKDAVKNRIEKMKRLGIIKGFLLRFNYHLLGYQYCSVFLKLKNITPEKRKFLLASLKSKKSIIAVFVQIGNWDLCVQAIVADAIELKGLISEIKEEFTDIIEDTDTITYFNQYFFTYLPDSIMKSDRFSD